jgi:hypothetical protein
MWASKNRGGHTAYFDDEVERTRSGGGEGTTSAASANVVIEGNGETNGSLGDDGWESDRNTGLPRLDIGATSADTEAGCTIGPASSEAGRASTLEEVGTRAR